MGMKEISGELAGAYGRRRLDRSLGWSLVFLAVAEALEQ